MSTPTPGRPTHETAVFRFDEHEPEWFGWRCSCGAKAQVLGLQAYARQDAAVHEASEASL